MDVCTLLGKMKKITLTVINIVTKIMLCWYH